MTNARKRKLQVVLLLLVVLATATALVLYALRQNISLFYSPTQIVLGAAPKHHSIRVGGMVVRGSIQRGQDLLVRFKITDYQNFVDVIYHGILPDLFREGQGIVAEGQWLEAHYFKATHVLAKHDENYMPKEVKDALKNSAGFIKNS